MSETSQSRWKTAWSFLMTVKDLLPEDDSIHTVHAPAINLLSGFIAELGLKAFLSGRGAPFGFNHDLQQLYSDYLRFGGRENGDVAALIEMIGAPHKRNFWRYMPSEEQLWVPTPATLAEHLETLLVSVANQLSGDPQKTPEWLELG